MEQRTEHVVIETARHRITGLVRLPREGYRSRLSDYLNTAERAFIAVTDVEIEPLDGTSPSERHPFLAVSLAHVVTVRPQQDESPAD